MKSSEAESLGAFSVDATVAHGFDEFMRGWNTQIGDGFPQPTYSPATIRDFRIRARAAKVRDVAIVEAHSTSPLRTTGNPGGAEDQVRLYVVLRGAWAMGGAAVRDEQTVSAGQFLLQHVGRPSHFQTEPHTTAQILVLPAATLKPLLGNRIITGPAASAETRLLVAHTHMIHAMMADLSPAGIHAAHSTLVELAKAVARRRFDDVEPQLAPALAQAAKDLANSRLADPELSPATLAQALNVSIRTLQRAFATLGESVTAYIRRRRLEEARLALTAPARRLSVTELAAYWQFADSSHFIRAFKKHYGQTPTDYTRSIREADRRP